MITDPDSERRIDSSPDWEQHAELSRGRRIWRYRAELVFLAIGVGVLGTVSIWLAVALTYEFATPYGWLSVDQLNALQTAAASLKDGAAGALAGWFAYKRLSRSDR